MVCALVLVAVMAQAAPKILTPSTPTKPVLHLTAAQLKAALTPPTRVAIKAMLHRNPALEQAVNKATLAVAAGAGGTGGTTGTTTATTVSLPPYITSCDWDKGIWLTYQHPIATATLPPSQYTGYGGLWYLMPVFNDVFALRGQYEYQFREALPCSATMATVWSDHESPAVEVWILPDKPGVYTIAMNIVTMDPGPVDWWASSGTEYGKVIGISQCDQVLLTYLQVDSATLNQMQSANWPAMVYIGTKQPRDWSFGGASITR
jgi:hypothetical protein